MSETKPATTATTNQVTDKLARELYEAAQGLLTLLGEARVGEDIDESDEVARLANALDAVDEAEIVEEYLDLRSEDRVEQLKRTCDTDFGTVVLLGPRWLVEGASCQLQIDLEGSELNSNDQVAAWCKVIEREQGKFMEKGQGRFEARLLDEPVPEAG